jgi:hypothetical protein
MMFNDFDKANITKKILKNDFMYVLKKINLRFTLFSIMQMISMDLNF